MIRNETDADAIFSILCGKFGLGHLPAPASVWGLQNTVKGQNGRLKGENKGEILKAVGGVLDDKPGIRCASAFTVQGGEKKVVGAGWQCHGAEQEEEEKGVSHG
jgi:hypothetical protein